MCKWPDLIQELNVGVVDQLGDHGNIGTIDRALPLENNGAAQGAQPVVVVGRI